MISEDVRFGQIPVLILRIRRRVLRIGAYTVCQSPSIVSRIHSASVLRGNN